MRLVASPYQPHPAAGDIFVSVFDAADQQHFVYTDSAGKVWDSSYRRGDHSWHFHQIDTHGFDRPAIQPAVGIAGARDSGLQSNGADPGRGEHDVARVLAIVDDKRLPLFVLGGGSNLLVADKGFDGIAVSLAAMAEP